MCRYDIERKTRTRRLQAVLLPFCLVIQDLDEDADAVDEGQDLICHKRDSLY